VSSDQEILIVQPTGELRCLYTELLELETLGKLSIARGSHVEPDTSGNWYADLSPVGGPKLGPFIHRSKALEAERTWLYEHWL
jgi:hypothetical protein